MKVLGLIPARAGSKSIRNKNVAPLAGKPLIEWTFEAAGSARLLDRLVVSTNCEQVKALARERLGLEIIDRPERLAGDYTDIVPVIQHALSMAGEPFDAVALLQPTCPMRRAEDIDGAIEFMERTGASSVISGVDVGANHPARMFVIDFNGVPRPLLGWEQWRWARKQDLPSIHIRSGDIYLARTDCISLGNLVGDKQLVYIIPPERHCNIDCERDLKMAELMMGDDQIARFEANYNRLIAAIGVIA